MQTRSQTQNNKRVTRSHCLYELAWIKKTRQQQQQQTAVKGLTGKTGKELKMKCAW